MLNSYESDTILIFQNLKNKHINISHTTLKRKKKLIGIKIVIGYTFRTEIK